MNWSHVAKLDSDALVMPFASVATDCDFGSMSYIYIMKRTCMLLRVLGENHNTTVTLNCIKGPFAILS